MVTGVYQFPADFGQSEADCEHIPIDSGKSETNFVLGPENGLLERLLRRLVALPQQGSWNYRPIVFWGPSGIGKSHVLHALRLIWQVEPRVNLEFYPAADWAREAIKRSMSQMSPHAAAPARRVLFLDDVHQLVGRETAQRQLIQTLDQLDHVDGLAILASRSCPASCNGLDRALVSRLMGGFSVEIKPPQTPARAQIISNLAAQSGWKLANSAAEQAAAQLGSNIRQVQTAVARSLPVRPLASESTSWEQLRSHLVDGPGDHANPVAIIQHIAGHYNVSTAAMKSASRKRTAVLARSVAMFLLREECGLALKEIGSWFGGRDHTTVLHACRKIEQQMATDADLNQLLNEFRINAPTT